MTRLRIDLAYDGGGFYGWAKQPELRTVQGTIEDALHKVLRVPVGDEREPLRLTVAGRTDTGVHASHQVAHLDVSDETLARCQGHMDVPLTEALARRLKAVLPADIVIHGIAIAPQGFDARFSALERTYVYRVADRSSEVDPRLRGCVLRVDESLDLDAMNAAAAMTIGLHDFGRLPRRIRVVPRFVKSRRPTGAECRLPRWCQMYWLRTRHTGRRRWNPAWLYSRLWPMLLLAIWFVRWSVPRSRLVRGAKRWNGLRTRWPIRCERGQAGQSHRKG